MLFRVELSNIQHLEALFLELDLSEHKLTCLVGRNGAGKTTLVRALRNLAHADTFLHTAPPRIFSSKSKIDYWVNGEKITYDFDEQLLTLNCKQRISGYIRNICAAELSIPFGNRFNYFQSISQVDRNIRQQIILGEYERPQELIDFLADVCSTNKFEALIETRIGQRSYFSILLDDGRYIREDYFSSGEYFLIDLYRTLTGPAKLIAVDEIDISLDAAAQVQLVKKLREFCMKYECNVVFTTHSLAMMRMLTDQELFFMERGRQETTISAVSYSFVKSLLFGFRGWDRYILTEDEVLANFLETFVHRVCQDIFFKYKIIYIGGGHQVVNLLARNRGEHFLSAPENVIAILDGDQEAKHLEETGDIYFLPFSNVEMEFARLYEDEKFPSELRMNKKYNGAKDLYKSVQRDRLMSSESINEYICEQSCGALVPLGDALRSFLVQGSP